MVDQPPPSPAPSCPFCAIGQLELPLTETPSFFAVGDHAPLVSGHILIVPKAHYTCYGAVPAALEDEFLGLKDTIRRFLTEVYSVPTFFEHGIFRQTVYHAHLHAFPFGPVTWELEKMAIGTGGQPAHGLANVRDWFASHGQYFYLETPGDAQGGAPAGESVPASASPSPHAPQAAIFPPEMGVYGRALSTLHQLTNAREGWSPPQLRYAMRGPKMRALAESWNAWRSQGA